VVANHLAIKYENEDSKLIIDVERNKEIEDEDFERIFEKLGDNLANILLKKYATMKGVEVTDEVLEPKTVYLLTTKGHARLHYWKRVAKRLAAKINKTFVNKYLLFIDEYKPAAMGIQVYIDNENLVKDIAYTIADWTIGRYIGSVDWLPSDDILQLDYSYPYIFLQKQCKMDNGEPRIIYKFKEADIHRPLSWEIYKEIDWYLFAEITPQLIRTSFIDPWS